MKKETPSNWEIRDRRYTLRNNMEPLTFTIPSKHTRKHSLLYFDEESGKQKELRYATNQLSFFIEKQSKEVGSVITTDIIFKYGKISVPANNITLQKFLEIHPHKNIIFKEIGEFI